MHFAVILADRHILPRHEAFLRQPEPHLVVQRAGIGIIKQPATTGPAQDPPMRWIVSPEKIDDLKARNLARDIANRISQELQFPGEIKVNVIRESRVIEFAK